MTKLKPCPFCGGAVQFRKALWPSDGNVDAIIHAKPTSCGLVSFYDGTTDESIIAEWNRQDERTARNRDMWKGQCDRQAAELTKMREALGAMLTEFAHNEHADCACKSCLAIRKGLVAMRPLTERSE